MHWTERLYYLCRSESLEKPIEQVFPTWSSNIISNDEIHFRVYYVHVHCLKLLRKLYRSTLLFWVYLHATLSGADQNKHAVTGLHFL